MDSKGFNKHISKQFNKELAGIVNSLLAMGGLVEQQLAGAVAALVEDDAEAAQRVVGLGRDINAMDLEIDESCVHILARRQPAASDLRLIIAVIKAVTDLERIGDEAERVGRMVLEAGDLREHEDLLVDMQRLGDGAFQTLHDALDSFARLDAEQAVAVARSDLGTDRRYEALIKRITDRMMQNPAAVPDMMNLMWAARSLERIGDRSCNICEYVIYLVKGKDVRHTSFEQLGARAGVEPE